MLLPPSCPLGRWFWILMVSIKGSLLSVQEEFGVRASEINDNDIIYLPYSETEDVDFTLSMPATSGCYQWSTEFIDFVSLMPHYIDYDNECGSRLDFQIIPGKVPQKTKITITAENVKLDMNEENTSDIVMVKDFEIWVAPLARLEVLSLSNELKSGSEAVPFGVTGYDADGNEFDSLDGLQIKWYIASERDIAKFDGLPKGSIINVLPYGYGAGEIIAVVSDENYKDVSFAKKDFTVKTAIFINPDPIYLMARTYVKINVHEVQNSRGEKTIIDISTNGSNSIFSLALKNSNFFILDQETSTLIAGNELGENTLYVKDRQNEIIKGMPIRVTEPDHVTITASVFNNNEESEEKQIILNRKYKLVVNIFNKAGSLIYPSENILCKLSIPSQFDVLEISDSGLWAIVHTISVGMAKVRVNLRSVLSNEDEEYEIFPHIKGSTDFEIYEKVVVRPKMSILPWDQNAENSYEIKFKATGGGKIYRYTVNKDELATVDSSGLLTTHSGPGVVTLTAMMLNSKSNAAEAKVWILPVSEIKFKETQVEFSTNSPLAIPIQMLAYIPDDEAKLFDDCSDIPFNVKLSNTKQFKIIERSKKGETPYPSSCAHILISGDTPGTSCRVTISYEEPISGKELRISKLISIHRPLALIRPKSKTHLESGTLFLPLGSSGIFIFQGGSYPWFQKPSAHFTEVEVVNPDLIRIEDKNVKSENYQDVYVFNVSCVEIGETNVLFRIGNQPSSSNMFPVESLSAVNVDCSLPASLKVNLESQTEKFQVDSKTGRIIVGKNIQFKLVLTVKNKFGFTFDHIDSLKFKFKISDPTMLMSTAQLDEAIFDHNIVPETFPYNVTVPSKYYNTFVTMDKAGYVDIQVSIYGFKESILQSLGIQKVPNLFFELEKSEEDLSEAVDYEDEELYQSHGHGLTETIHIKIVADENQP